MKLELQNKTKEIEILGEKVTVSGRISSIEKETIIIGALKNSMIDGTYNRLFYEESLYVGILVHYSDIGKKLEDKSIETTPWIELYDLFDSNGIIGTVIDAVNSLNDKEIESLLNYATQIYEESKATLDSSAYAISNFAGLFGTTLDQIGVMMQAIADKQAAEKEEIEKK